MLIMKFTDETSLQWLDLQDRLIDTDMINSTYENPLTIKFNEVPEPLVNQLPFAKRSNYKTLVSNSGIKRFYIGEDDEVTLDYTKDKILINAHGGVFETDWNPVSGDLPYSASSRYPGANMQNQIYLVESYEKNGVTIEDSFRVSMFTGNGRYGDKSNQMYWGYIGNEWFATSDRTLMGFGGYTYIAKFKTTRYDFNGNVVNNFGICFISSPEILQADKEYKCITTEEIFDKVYSNKEEEGWINIKYKVYDSNNLVTKTSHIDYPDYFNSDMLQGISYSRLDTFQRLFICMIGIEGALANSSEEIRKEVITLANLSQAGFYKLYGTTEFDDLVQLNNTFWSVQQEESVNNYNIMSAILSFGILPIEVTPGITKDDEGNNILSANEQTLKIGGREIPNNQWNTFDTQYLHFDSSRIYYKGQYTGKPYHYLDFQPYTQSFVTIPYVGTESVNPSDIINRFIIFEFILDVFTGTLVCKLWITKSTGTEAELNLLNPQFKDDYQILSTYTGNCLINVPLSSNNYLEAITKYNELYQSSRRALISSVGHAVQAVGGIVKGAGAIAATAGTGGVAAPIAAGVASNAMNNISSGFGGLVNDFTTAVENSEKADLVSYPSASVSYGGSSSGTAGIMDDQRVKINTIYPIVDEEVANLWYKSHGYQTYSTGTFVSGDYLRLSDVTGKPSGGINRPEPNISEFNKFVEILKGGVYV